jgi:hypothetical protein
MKWKWKERGHLEIASVGIGVFTKNRNRNRWKRTITSRIDFDAKIPPKIPLQGLEPWYPAWKASMITTYIIVETPHSTIL